jgi:hypothetical protein
MLTYNGPAANCNLHLVLAKIGALSPGAAPAVSVSIVDSTCTVLSSPLNLVLDPAVYYNGTFDFPFTIPDTGGSPITLFVEVQCGAGGSGFVPYHVQNTLTGTFSNISVSGPNWSGLNWNQIASCIPYALVQNGAGTASFTPITGLSNSFTAFADEPNCMTDQATSQNGAMLIYNGPALNCNLRLVLSKIGAFGRFTNGVQVGVDIVDSSCNVLSSPLALDLDPAVFYTGTFDFPFTIPDTGGLSVTLSVWVVSGMDIGGGTPDHLQNQFTGTFSVI